MSLSQALNQFAQNLGRYPYSLISPISLLSRKKAKRRCEYSTTLMPLIAQPFNPLQEQARVCSFSSTIFQSSFSTIVFNGS